MPQREALTPPNIGGAAVEVHQKRPSGGQYAKAILFTAIGSAGSGSSLYLNVTFGLLFNPIVAVGFGLADLAFFAISTVVRQAEGWRIKLRLMQGVFLLMSCIAAGFHLFEIFEQRANDAARVTDRVEVARRNAETARVELERINAAGVSGDVASLEAQYRIKAEQAAADKARGNCGTEVKRVTFLACQALQEEAAKMQERIGAAKRRDELEATKRAAEAIASETETKADSMTSIARAVGTSNDTFYLIIMGLVLVTFMLCSMLAEEAGEMWADIIALRKAWKASVEPQMAHGPRPVIEAVIQPEVSEKDAAYNWIVTQIQRTPDRQLVISGRQLSKTLGKANATFMNWVISWEEEGKLIREKTGNKTTFTVPKNTRVRRAA